MNKKINQSGITLVALIITVVLMLILVAFVYNFSRDAIDKTKLEDIKTNMLLIQSKAKTIYERYSFKEIEELTGIEYSPTGNQDIGYTVGAKLRVDLNKSEGPFYIWEQEDLNNNGLGTIKVSNTEFYIIDYTTGEVFYSLGYTQDDTTYYRLSELESL